MINTATLTNEKWIDLILPKYVKLTKSVVVIMESLLQDSGIDYLTVIGRTKEKSSALQKIKRKGYTDPEKSLTDLSGIRIVLYFESDVRKVCDLISKAFEVDVKNSLDKDSLLSTNKIGYRSVHYVCSLGPKRSEIDEYKGLSGMSFEFQIRTVLQHAWAELAHDRKYKFSGKLPNDLERKLYLYAGLLEIADKGFDETAQAIDSYSKNLLERTSHGDLNIEIDSISLESYIQLWAERNNIILDVASGKTDLGDLVRELREFGIFKLNQLQAIVPPEYAPTAKREKYDITIYGVVRDWMLIKDWRRFISDVSFDWIMDSGGIIQKFIPIDEFDDFSAAFEWDQDIGD